MTDNIFSVTEEFMQKAHLLQNTYLPHEHTHPIREIRRETLWAEYRRYLEAEAKEEPSDIAEALLTVAAGAWGTLLTYFGPEVTKKLSYAYVASVMSMITEDGIDTELRTKPHIPEILEEAGF